MALLIAVCLFLNACGESPGDKESRSNHTDNNNKTEGTVQAPDLSEQRLGLQNIPPSQQRPGNAEAGWQALTTEPIVSCGLPLDAFKQLQTDTSFTLDHRQGKARSLPYNVNLITNNEGVELAASNCLTCHAAPLFGELVIGLGNEFLDFTANASVGVEQAGALVSGNKAIAAWEKFADRVAAIAPYMQTETAGVNPANNLTFALMSHRDPTTMAWSPTPVLPTPTVKVPPVSVPPWWRMSKKHAMFWMGEGRGDHASVMMTAAILCTDSLAELEALDAIAADVRAFIASVKPPTYPFDVNAALAEQGQAVFNRTCSGCHGHYGDNPDYPNMLVGIDVVGTDSALIDYAFAEGQVFVDWFNSSPFGKQAKAQPGRGYVAPPLDGIWSTAPFLHNGSVPTIEAVLNSASRPEIWQHLYTSSESKSAYDQRRLGWRYKVLTASELLSRPATHTEPGDQWIYDTRRQGYSSKGHVFGDALSNEERSAVLEYLKTL